MNKWDPDSYLKYKEERTQPSYDLVARIEIANPANIIDIGCGPGNSTRALRERWPNARILGLDSSQDMIEKARNAFSQEDWILADATEWKTDEKYDIVFSNAALQWIPNHDILIPKLFDLVNNQGALAVQVPANNHSPLHKAVLRVSKREEWRESTNGCDSMLTYRNAGFYYDQLSAISVRINIWQTTYYHIMVSHQDLIDWYASTGMRPYLERFKKESERYSFREQVLEECTPHYPKQEDGKILFPFNRIFFVAYK
jgi:trans-aconitate 2-methyltransferase